MARGRGGMKKPPAPVAIATETRGFVEPDPMGHGQPRRGAPREALAAC